MKSVANIIICSVFVIVSLSLKAQSGVVRSESFDGTIFPPLGWKSGRISGTDLNNYTERVTFGSQPACAPHSGAGMIRYRSGFMFNPGEQAFLASPRYDLTNNPGTATVSFWMYKDNLNTIRDSVTLYVNDSAVANAGRVSMTKVIGPFSRDTTGFNGWKQYTALIPPGYNTSSLYLVFVFTNRETAAGANIYLDDVSLVTFPKPSVVVSSELFYQETTLAQKGVTDQLIIGIRVKVDGAGDSLRVDSIVTNANGTSSLFDIASFSAKIWFTKGSDYYTHTAANQFGTGIGATFFRDKFTQAGFFLENGDNYFWLSYSVQPGATVGNLLDADFNGIYYRKTSYTGPDTSAAPLVSSVNGSRPIGQYLCSGIIPVLSSGTSANNYLNNDYINRVYMRGANTINPGYPYLDNNFNDHGPSVSPWFGGPAPFTSHPPDYQYFSQFSNALHPNITAVLTQGSTYMAPVIVPAGVGNGGLALQCGAQLVNNYMAAWIDFNRDGDLLDPGELIHQSGPLNNFAWTYATVNVPFALGSSTSNSGSAASAAGVVYGNTTLRVREVYGNNIIDPCQSGYAFGETEDYVVTIIPACSSGLKRWLGYTDDWNNPANWCNGLPGISDLTVIDRSLVNSITYMEPVIHSGTSAKVKTIWLSDQDTLTVDAPVGSSLQVADSLAIAYNKPSGSATGLFKVNSIRKDTVAISNGGLSANVTPFSASRKNQRMQLIFTKNELLAKGLMAGDYIDQFLFHIRQRANPSVALYNGFTIKYATVDSTWNGWPAIPTSLAPATSTYVTLFGPASLSLPINQGSAGDLLINLTGKIYWNGVSNLVIEICYDNSLVSLGGILSNDGVYQTQTTGHNYTLWASNISSNSGCSLNWPLPPGTSANATAYRPNITFHYERPYSKFPIYITGNNSTSSGTWVNNGNFNAGYSSVTFSNNSLKQTISGANSTTFNELVIDKSGSSGTEIVELMVNINIDSSLLLQHGKLQLNAKNLTINYPKATGIIRNGGGIICEKNTTPYGFVKWKINGNTSSHVIPFITASSDYIPFTYKVNSGSVGTVSVATYHANSNVQPYPSGVTNVNDSIGNSNIAYTVKRYWIINKSGSGGNADFKFSYKNSEALAPILKNNVMPNRYEYITNLWQRFSLPVINVVGGSISSCKIQNVTGANLTNAVWALSDAGSPLRETEESQLLATAWPNPFQKSFFIRWEAHHEFHVELLDMAGRMVYDQKVINGEELQSEKELDPGFYIVRLTDTMEVKTLRMIKVD